MNIGKMNYWLTRLLFQLNRFVQLANFGMLLYLTSKENALVWLLIPAGLALITAWFFFDNNKILEEELDYQYLRIPVIRQMRDDIKEIKEGLKT